MKVLHTADWHLGTFRSPVKNGVNLRTEDTKRCLDEMIRVAKEEQPDYVLVSGDVFNVGRPTSDRCCEEIVTATHYIRELAAVTGHVVVMRGTPNHDGIGQFNVLNEIFYGCQNVHIITTPQVLSFNSLDIAVLPGFDSGIYRTKRPGLSKEEENIALSNELGNIVTGLKTQCKSNRMNILMAHYTVPGCNTESGQTMFLSQFEPVLMPEALLAADFDLVALGHIHRPQQVLSNNWFYSGAINALNFNDEGQERGFWIHNFNPGYAGNTLEYASSVFYKTPIREFKTIFLDNDDISQFNLNAIDMVAACKWRGEIEDKIVRVFYSCTEENAKALNTALLEKEILEDGAFMVWERLPDKIDEFANRTELSNTTDPEANLIKYLEEKQFPTEKIQELVLKARPIITEAEANMPTAANTGVFEPIEISVRNYRNYEEETFNFADVTFCTINGQNGAGKSSLFMDAVIDCLYEEPREGELSGWVRNDENGSKGMIMFTFRIGERTYRVTRTRSRPKSGAKTRTGEGKLNLAELVGEEWENRSKERQYDTQQEIINILGMDSFTFKSCALIMQDQYGLFLQAKPEERGEVLGTLLGLGIYPVMEKIVADKAQAAGAKNRELKREIEIHDNTISDLGNPDDELEAHRAELAECESRLQVEIKERDSRKLILANQQQAAERRTKLLAEINALQVKRDSVEQNRVNQQLIIDSTAIILDSRSEIEAKVAEYNAQLEREKMLAGESALYSAKKTEAENYRYQAEREQGTIDNMKSQILQKETELASLQSTEQDAIIRENAAEYERYNGLLRQAQELHGKYADAVAEKDRRAYAVDSKRVYINQEKCRMETKKADLERRTELLKNSGCPDIEHAECRFLSDALDAKKQLPIVEAEILDFAQKEDAALQILVKAMEEAEQKVRAVEYDEGLLKEYQSKVSELSGAPTALKKMEERNGQIALIRAKKDNLQSNMLEAEKRLAEVKLKGMEAEQERDRYAKSFEEHAVVQNTILLLKPWLEKEKQLPVAEERKTTATGRMLELASELIDIDAEITEKKKVADQENESIKGIEELTNIVFRMDSVIDSMNVLIKEKQIKIGALQQKSEQIARLKKEIQELQEKQVEYAKETADFDILKAAFSQNGVPHQIIRSIIPKLTATSNTILGQMTGGKMGVEFRLERVQKGNGKEKASLDIFIEECGKPALPYLSKSGGEKVKSSLAVILALAEIKSSSAGIQLGMLFIDEPPFLDADGVDAYCDALETIQGRYKNIKIMAITHDLSMKARFPQNLDVVKTENGSKVIY